MKMRLAAVCVVGCTILPGCDKDNPLAPDLGRAEAIVHDSSTNITGSLAGNVKASVFDGSKWHDLGSLNGITIPFGGAAVTVHGEQSIPATSYSRVRLTLDDVTARIATGSVVDGTTLTSEATLTLGGTDGFVEITIPVASFSVETTTDVKRTIVFDLRSRQWLTSSALLVRFVEDAPLRAAVTASTRLDSR